MTSTPDGLSTVTGHRRDRPRGQSQQSPRTLHSLRTARRVLEWKLHPVLLTLKPFHSPRRSPSCPSCPGWLLSPASRLLALGTRPAHSHHGPLPTWAGTLSPSTAWSAAHQPRVPPPRGLSWPPLSVSSRSPGTSGVTQCVCGGGTSPRSMAGPCGQGRLSRCPPCARGLEQPAPLGAPTVSDPAATLWGVVRPCHGLPLSGVPALPLSSFPPTGIQGTLGRPGLPAEGQKRP